MYNLKGVKTNQHPRPTYKDKNLATQATIMCYKYPYTDLLTVYYFIKNSLTKTLFA